MVFVFRARAAARRMLALAGLALVAGTAPPAQAAFDLPSIERIVRYQPKLPLQVLTADGVEIAQFGAERRQYVPLAQIPKQLQDAVLAVEDIRFREHSGIDARGLARAAWATLTGGRQGGSTITQQLVRTMLLTHQFSIERKAKEMLLALEVEKALGKDRILEIYLNEIFLGQRAYGVAAAAQTYFGKPLDKLSLAETALIAGLPQNPYYANPIANFERSRARQRVVLGRLREVGLITERQLAEALAERLEIRSPLQQPVNAAHAAEMARQVVVQRFGTEAYTQGLKVVTSLRAADQRSAHAAVRRGVLAFDRKGAWRGPEAREALSGGSDADVERAAALALKEHRDDETLRVAVVLAASPREVRVQLASGARVSLAGEGLRWALPGLQPKAPAALKLERGAIVRVVERVSGTRSSWSIAQWPQAEAALVALDPASGRVRALVGGFDFSRQPFNHVTQGWRQPGSSFKPLLYSAALEQRVMPGTRVDDSPYTAANGWSPQNSDGEFAGTLTLREALARSRNVVSVRVLEQVGVPRAREWAARFGLDAQRQSDNLTLALGTGSVTPMQMAGAYATLANGGYRVEPVLIERIVDAQGKVLFEATAPAAPAEAARVIPERNAYVTASLLNEVTRSGTAAKAQAQLRRADLYGKTGTTNDAVDAWFVGWQPTLAAAVWMGYDTPRSLGDRESGGGLALPIWIDFMGAVLKGVPVAPPGPLPAGVQRDGNELIYAEWLGGGAVAHIAADGVHMALPPASTAPADILESGGAAEPAASAPQAPAAPPAAPAPVTSAR